MGLFKSKEEKIAERKELKRRITDSLMTQMIQNLGYEDLPNDGVCILKKIMLDTLRDIPHLTVMDSGYIMYNADRPKNAW